VVHRCTVVEHIHVDVPGHRLQRLHDRVDGRTDGQAESKYPHWQIVIALARARGRYRPVNGYIDHRGRATGAKRPGRRSGDTPLGERQTYGGTPDRVGQHVKAEGRQRIQRLGVASGKYSLRGAAVSSLSSGPGRDAIVGKPLGAGRCLEGARSASRTRGAQLRASGQGAEYDWRERLPGYALNRSWVELRIGERGANPSIVPWYRLSTSCRLRPRFSASIISSAADLILSGVTSELKRAYRGSEPDACRHCRRPVPAQSDKRRHEPIPGKARPPVLGRIVLRFLNVI